jgi:type III secretion system YscC/HrcC family outer membrane pore protein
MRKYFKALLLSRLPLCVITAVVMTSILTATPAWAGELVWKNQLFKQEVSGENVRDTLQHIASLNGVGLITQGDVKGEVFRSFKNETLEVAFKMLLDEFKLRSEWNSEGNYLMVYPAGANPSAPVLSLVRLKAAAPLDIKNILMRFNLWLPTYEVFENSIFMRGTQQEVDNSVLVIKELDQAAGEQLKNRIYKKTIENFSQPEVFEVIPLNYASVGETVISLRPDETIRVPGIDVTIKEILGFKDKSKADKDGFEASLPYMSSSRGDEKNMDDQLMIGFKMNMMLDKPPTVSVDPRTNSVVVRGRPEQVERVKELIKKLDKPIPLVEITVVIVEANDGFSNQLGVNWKFSRETKNTAYSIGTLPGGKTIAAKAADATSGGSGQTGVTAVSPVLSLVNDSLGQLLSQISALESAGLGRVLASPRLLTLDNRSSEIKSGQEIYVKVATETKFDVKSVKTGIIFKVIPHIINLANTDDRQVRMTIHAERSSFQVDYTADAIPGTNTREINTEIIMRENETTVLGGLFETEASQNTSGVPFLKDIPLIGLLFRDSGKTLNRRELMFFITPRVVEISAMEAAKLPVEGFLEKNRDELKKKQEETFSGKPADAKGNKRDEAK